MMRTVGVGDLVLSADPDDVIITYALGSCLGLTVWDPVTRVGGMLHAMLPQSSIEKDSAQLNVAKFVDTGVPALFKGAYALGAVKARLIVAAAGCGSPRGGDGDDFFAIGKRNLTMLRQLLWRNGVLLKRADVGGSKSRTLTFRLADGSVTIKSEGVETLLVGAGGVELCAAG